MGQVCEKCSGRDSAEDERLKRHIEMTHHGMNKRSSTGGGAQRRTIMGEVRPPPREQGEWLSLCPNGGPLLKLQVCIAAQGEEGSEWFIGRLFVAEVGIYVESTDDENYTSGLVRWEDITAFTVDHPSKSKKNEVMISKDGMSFRVQVGSPFNVEWLQETYQASSAPVERWFSFGTACSDDDIGDGAARYTLQDPWLAGTTAFDFTDGKLPNPLPMVSEEERKGTKVFYNSIAPQMRLEEVAKVMLVEDWPMNELLIDKLKCKDITTAPWKESARFPEGHIRYAKYILPVPKNPNIPAAIQKLVGVPEFAGCLSHQRIHIEPDQITMLMQSGSKGVQHGDNLCIQALMIWRQQQEDVVFTEYLSLIWVQPLAFFARPAKPFIEGQAKEDAVTMAKCLDAAIKKDIMKLRQKKGAAA